MKPGPTILDNPELMQKLEQDIANGCELNWLLHHYSYDTGVQLDSTPIVNFCNYRYKIVEIFSMTYKHEKAILGVEIATPDIMLILGTFSEYKVMNRILDLNQAISRGGHSWPKLLSMAKSDVRLLVNTAFVIMHLFAGDLVALTDNEIVFCYILAAAVVGSMNKDGRAALSKDIQKRGLKRPQRSISDRAQSSFGIVGAGSKIPKDISGVSESLYSKRYLETLSSLPPIDENKRFQETPIDTFISTARRLSVRKSCLQSLSSVEKDLPQVGRLLHLGRESDSEPHQLVYYIGEENMATPATDLGSQRYKTADSRSVYSKNSRSW